MIAGNELKTTKTLLDEFVSRAEIRHHYGEVYENELQFQYKGRNYALSQAVYHDGEVNRYQHYLQRDGRLLNIGALRKVLAEMSWELRYPDAQNTAHG